MIKAGIFGTTGYTGYELARILWRHPGAQIQFAASQSQAGRRLSDLYPAGPELPLVHPKEASLAEIDVLFLCLPHTSAAPVAIEALKERTRVVDLSADFRLKDPGLYSQWYGHEHPAPHLLGEAVYGLSEFAREELPPALLVANPGCYPTSAILGAAPLLSKGLIDTESIIADSKSGVSGAGRWPGEGFNFCEIEENFKAYKIASHRHQPEMEQELSKLAKKEIKISFTPHLVPIKRGILTTLYLDLKKGMTTEEVLRIFQDFYKDEPFIKVLESDKFPEVKNVCGTNFCHIGCKVDERTKRVIVISAIDNLVKGASGQAVQNMNIICGFNEKEGLEQVSLIP